MKRRGEHTKWQASVTRITRCTRVFFFQFSGSRERVWTQSVVLLPLGLTKHRHSFPSWSVQHPLTQRSTVTLRTPSSSWQRKPPVYSEFTRSKCFHMAAVVLMCSIGEFVDTTISKHLSVGFFCRIQMTAINIWLAPSIINFFVKQQSICIVLRFWRHIGICLKFIHRWTFGSNKLIEYTDSFIVYLLIS